MELKALWLRNLCLEITTAERRVDGARPAALQTAMLFSSSQPVPLPPGPGAADLPSAARIPTSELEALKFDVERLLLITEALWNIIREKHGAEETELIKQITALDMEDGKLDGRKPRTPPQPCPKCGRTLIKNRPRCFYCAEPIAADPFER